uniref:Uncharacterized protein n=1 Tax=Cucumis sativus TaxID=3659 RepID=A0A0A0LE39_CUCSA
MIKFGVFRLEGKVTIITGGASGIGASTARIFHENGAKVIIADIQDKVGQKIAHKLGEDVSYIHCDVMQEDDVAKLVDTTVHRHGKLDIMYNNAGVIDRKHGGIFDVTKFDLDKVVGVNVMDAFWGAKHATRVMIPKKNGCILFTSSATTNVAGLSTHSYASSKCAVLGARVPAKAIEILTTSWANLKGRVLKADDIAMAVLYLASDDANYVSGLNLVVDGGYSFVNPSMLN